MKVKDALSRPHPAISFEFFPPKSAEGFASLMETVTQLKALAPSSVSITYGAGGSTRQKTVELVSKIKNEIGIEATAHLTCVGHSKQELELILEELESNGIENILALRGDPPKGETDFRPNPDGFRYASELVAFIKSRFSFCVGVAGYPEKHPEAPSLEADLTHLAEKVQAGADFIVTQLFFDNRPFFQFVERLRKMGVRAPVVPGIMPITDVDQIKRFTTMCGATLPAELLMELERSRGDKARVLRLGIDTAVRQCRDLLQGGVPGLHFYTLNKSQSTREIYMTLKNEGKVTSHETV